MNCLAYFCNPEVRRVEGMDGDGEVNNVAAKVELGQAEGGEDAEGNKTEWCILGELSLSAAASVIVSTSALLHSDSHSKRIECSLMPYAFDDLAWSVLIDMDL